VGIVLSLHGGQIMKTTDAQRRAQKKWNAKNKEKIHKTSAAWTERNRESKRASTRKHDRMYPEKYAAHNALRHAINAGKIRRPDTCPCGNPKPEGHHPDYSKPLMVMWLCMKCHRELHRVEKDAAHQLSLPQPTL
jgi:hypothetical protein